MDDGRAAEPLLSRRFGRRDGVRGLAVTGRTRVPDAVTVEDTCPESSIPGRPRTSPRPCTPPPTSTMAPPTNSARSSARCSRATSTAMSSCPSSPASVPSETAAHVPQRGRAPADAGAPGAHRVLSPSLEPGSGRPGGGVRRRARGQRPRPRDGTRPRRAGPRGGDGRLPSVPRGEHLRHGRGHVEGALQRVTHRSRSGAGRATARAGRRRSRHARSRVLRGVLRPERASRCRATT